MKKILTILIVSSFLSSSAQDARKEIEGLLEYQRLAWNEGNIEKFMEVYWKSDQLMFVGKTGIIYGWESTLNRYKKNYPTKADMGILRFEILEFQQISNDSVLLIGKWKLEKKEGEPQGHFSLFWKRIGSEWKIIIDHTS